MWHVTKPKAKKQHQIAAENSTIVILLVYLLEVCSLITNKPNPNLKTLNRNTKTPNTTIHTFHSKRHFDTKIDRHYVSLCANFSFLRKTKCDMWGKRKRKNNTKLLPEMAP